MSRINIIFILLVISMFTYGQKASININFSVTYDSVSIYPDSIMVENLTTGDDTTLYGSDTTLIIDYTTGLDNNYMSSNGLILLSGHPNPFEVKTNFDMFIPESGEVIIMVYNLNGSEITTLSGYYLSGSHSFIFTSGGAGLYILKAIYKNKIYTLKLMSLGGNKNHLRLDYSGRDTQHVKSKRSLGGFHFTIGDQLGSYVYYQSQVDTTVFIPTKDTTIIVNYCSAGNPPIAEFSANPTSGIRPLTVNFTDQSLNSPTSWNWDFGDGSVSSSLQNPDHLYNSTGTYTVKLIASNTCGSDTLTKVNYIVVTSPPCPSTFIDQRDTTVYSAVKMGNQCWMAENLAYLPSVSPSVSGSFTQAYYYVYDYEGTDVTMAKATGNYNTYGVLYNWPAVMDGQSSSNSVPSGVQGVCPNGWHVPSDEEWKILEGLADFQYDYPDPEWDGMYWRGSDAGGNLKETGTAHWNYPNVGATNFAGFTALPGGYRDSGGNSFFTMGLDCHFWTSTEISNTIAIYRRLYYNRDDMYRDDTVKIGGFSLRCLLD